MEIFKKFLPYLITLAVGFSSAVFIFSEKEVIEEVEIETTPETLATDAKEIKEIIVTKYITEKDPAKRLEMSDEIMEKVILLFMANLGIKLSDREKKLVEDPKSYEKYMRDVMTLCPELPKRTGPEVFLNDGSDEIRQKLEKELNTCKETYGGLNKKPKLKTDEQKRRFINFEDNIFKKFGRTPLQVFPFDIASELWTEKPYIGKLQSMPENFTEVYEGALEGIYRTRSGEQGHVKISVSPKTSKDKKKVYLKFTLTSRLGVKLNQVFLTEHPEGHSNGGKGPCRGMVLSYENESSKVPVMHFVKVPGREGYFGRVYSSESMVSSFFVMKDFSKKKLNPRRWSSDLGYC